MVLNYLYKKKNYTISIDKSGYCINDGLDNLIDFLKASW
jgi:hypothetical protein